MDIKKNYIEVWYKGQGKKRPLETLQDEPVHDKQVKGAPGKLSMLEHSAIRN
jgi:hypothetical protein